MSGRGAGRMFDVAPPAKRDGAGAQRDGERGADERRREMALGLVPAHTPPRVQRTSLPELFMAIYTPGRGDAGSLLVEDDAQTLTSGQMRKGDFMRELRTEVTRVADEELASSGRTSADCPYLDQMLRYYEGRTAEHLERAIRLYAPEARNVRDAHDYVPLVGQRLGRGIARWVITGQMPDDVPNEALAAMTGASTGGLGAAAPARGVARKGAAGSGGTTVDAGALMRGLGPGRPLDGGTRARMEGALGHSFAGVRIHADDQAAALSHDLAARAFTIGPHVAFGAGELRPGTAEGDALLAHELAHVVQQGGSTPGGNVPIGGASDPLEHDADAAAAAAVRSLHGAEEESLPPLAKSAGGLRLQRCPSQPRQVVTGPPPQPAVDPMIARYAEAMVELRRLAPDMQALLAMAPLGGGFTRIATQTLGPTSLFYDLKVQLEDRIEGGATEAMFRSPGRDAITRSGGNFLFPMRMLVARNPFPTAAQLAASLYHEGVHMRLFMDEIIGPTDPQASPYSASHEGYKTTARAAPDWNPLVTAWAATLGGDTALATQRIDHLIQEKYAFNASEARMGASQQRSNREVAVANLADEDGVGTDLANITRLLVSVFDHIDTQRATTVPAFPAAPPPPPRAP